MVFSELANFFKGNLHLKTSYALLEKYSSAKIIACTRIDTLTNILAYASKGRYSYDEAVKLKQLAKNSIGIENQAIDFQIKCIIQQLKLLREQICNIDKNIKEIMDLLNSKILTIPGIGYTLGAMIISEIADVHRFSNPTKLLAYVGLDPSVRQLEISTLKLLESLKEVHHTYDMPFIEPHFSLYIIIRSMNIIPQSVLKVNPTIMH